MPARADFRQTEAELFSDELLNYRQEKDFSGFVDYLGGELLDYESGERKFEYVDNLTGTEEYVDESGPHKKTLPVDGKYTRKGGDIPDKIEIDSKHRGYHSVTFATLAHELYHKWDPDEGSEDYVELMAGMALRKLSENDRFAENAFEQWRYRQYWRKQDMGNAEWSKRMRTVYSRLAHTYPEEMNTLERYAEAAGGKDANISGLLIEGVFAVPKWIENRGRKLYNFVVADTLKSYLGLDLLSVEDGPKVTDWFEGLTKALYKVHKEAREKAKAAGPKPAAPTAGTAAGP